MHPAAYVYASQNREVIFGFSRLAPDPECAQERPKKMLTRFCARYTFRSAILKDRLTSATARLSVNSSIDHGAAARRLMRPKCAAFALRKWNDESSTRPGAAILISVTAKASSWLDDFAPKF